MSNNLLTFSYFFVINFNKKITYKDQFLTIKTQNGGGGDFYIIETERWAFDNIPELVTTLMRFYTKHKLIKSKELE